MKRQAFTVVSGVDGAGEGEWRRTWEKTPLRAGVRVVSQGITGIWDMGGVEAGEVATVLPVLLILHSLGRSPPWLDPDLHLPHAHVWATELGLEKTTPPCWLASLESMPRISGWELGVRGKLPCFSRPFTLLLL